MKVIQEDKVFLVRGDELLLFKRNDSYDGDDVNIEDYTIDNFLKYIVVKKDQSNIKQVFYYFAPTSDQYMTQWGEWIEIETAIHYPAKPVTSAVLKNYICEGQYDNEIRIGVKNEDNVDFTIITK